MATEDRHDDLLRDALERAVVPPPPAFDAKALAGAALAGAKARRRRLAWKRGWTGLGMAVLVIITAFWIAREQDADRSVADDEHRASAQVAEQDRDRSQRDTHGDAERNDLSNGQATDAAERTASNSGAFAKGSAERHAAAKDATDEGAPLLNQVSDTLVGAEPGMQHHQVTDHRDRTDHENIDATQRAVENPALTVTWQGTDEPPFLLDPRSTPWTGSLSQPVPATARTVANDAAPMERFTLALWGSMDHSTYSVPNTESEGSLDALEAGQQFTGTVGARIHYALDRHWGVLAGLQYSNKGNLYGVVRTSATRSTTYRLSGAYYEVPLAVRYTIPLEGKDLYASAGTSFQFNARAGTDKVAVNDEQAHQLSTVTLAPGSVGTMVDLGVGIRFRLGRGVGAFVEPAYRIGLSPLVKHPSFDELPVNPRVNTLSLGIGLTFKLSR